VLRDQRQNEMNAYQNKIVTMRQALSNQDAAGKEAEFALLQKRQEIANDKFK
jgi:hypothetical protein